MRGQDFNLKPGDIHFFVYVLLVSFEIGCYVVGTVSKDVCGTESAYNA